MRSIIRSVAIIGILAKASVQGQAGLSACGMRCFNSILAEAFALGCSGGPDPNCLCKNENFFNNLMACGTQFCKISDATTLNAWGIYYCSGPVATTTFDIPPSSTLFQVSTSSVSISSLLVSRTSSFAPTPSLSTPNLSVSRTSFSESPSSLSTTSPSISDNSVPPSSTLDPASVTVTFVGTPSSQGLETGTKIEIGVGVGCAVILAVWFTCCCYCCYFDRRKQQRKIQAKRDIEETGGRLEPVRKRVVSEDPERLERIRELQHKVARYDQKIIAMKKQSIRHERPRKERDCEK